MREAEMTRSLLLEERQTSSKSPLYKLGDDDEKRHMFKGGDDEKEKFGKQSKRK